MICGPGVHVDLDIFTAFFGPSATGDCKTGRSDVLPMAVELHAILVVASLAAPVLFLR